MNSFCYLNQIIYFLLYYYKIKRKRYFEPKKILEIQKSITIQKSAYLKNDLHALFIEKKYFKILGLD